MSVCPNMGASRPGGNCCVQSMMAGLKRPQQRSWKKDTRFRTTPKLQRQDHIPDRAFTGRATCLSSAAAIHTDTEAVYVLDINKESRQRRLTCMDSAAVRRTVAVSSGGSSDSSSQLWSVPGRQSAPTQREHTRHQDDGEQGHSGSTVWIKHELR